MPGPGEVAARLRYAGPGARSGRRAGAAGRVDARPSSRRRAARGAGRHPRLARVDRDAGALQRGAAVHRTGGAWCAGEATEAESHEWQEDLRRAVATIAGLTAVDGATIITDRFELMAFGAKITRRRGIAAVRARRRHRAGRGQRDGDSCRPPQLGGTRHLSAAQFVVRPARRDRARRLAGRTVHDLQVVADGRHGPRAPGGSAASSDGVDLDRDQSCAVSGSTSTPSDTAGRRHGDAAERVRGQQLERRGRPSRRRRRLLRW